MDALDPATILQRHQPRHPEPLLQYPSLPEIDLDLDQTTPMKYDVLGIVPMFGDGPNSFFPVLGEEEISLQQRTRDFSFLDNEKNLKMTSVAAKSSSRNSSLQSLLGPNRHYSKVAQDLVNGSKTIRLNGVNGSLGDVTTTFGGIDGSDRIFGECSNMAGDRGVGNLNFNNARNRFGRGAAAKNGANVPEQTEGGDRGLGLGWQALASNMAAEQRQDMRGYGRGGGGGGGRERNATSMGFFGPTKDGSSPFRPRYGGTRSSFGINNNQIEGEGGLGSRSGSNSGGGSGGGGSGMGSGVASGVGSGRGSGGGSRSGGNGLGGEEAAANAANYEDALGDCLDFIDDEYKEARENAKNYHKSLVRIYQTLKSNLQPGAPIGSRWNAFKSAFKAGKIDRYPDIKLAKEFEAYEKVIPYVESPLKTSVNILSQWFRLLCASKEALEFDLKTKFLNQLYDFVAKDWKDVVVQDKAVQNLAIKIQKAKADARDHATIADMLDQFKHQRTKTLGLFNFILDSDYGQILKFEDLVDCYIEHHKEILEILEKMRAMLAEQAKRAKPLEPDVEGGAGKADGRSKGCLGTCTIPCVPVDGQMNSSPMDTREVEMEMQRIYGAELPPKSGERKTDQPKDETPVSPKSSGEIAGGAAFLKYMEKRIRTRPYGFAKEAFEATNDGELSLHVGEMVYLTGKPGFDRYNGEKEDGTKGTFPQNALDVIVDIC